MPSVLVKAVLLLAATTIVNAGPAANGRTVALTRGTKLVITLPANASTGYAWRIVSKPTPVLRRVSQRYVSRKSRLLGVSGQYVATFAAGSKGRNVLRLAYVRRTHPATPPAQRYRLVVVVR